MNADDPNTPHQPADVPDPDAGEDPMDSVLPVLTTFDFEALYRGGEDRPAAPEWALALVRLLLLDPEAVAARRATLRAAAEEGAEAYPDAAPGGRPDFAEARRVLTDVGVCAAHEQGLLTDPLVEHISQLLNDPDELAAVHRALVGELAVAEPARPAPDRAGWHALRWEVPAAASGGHPTPPGPSWVGTSPAGPARPLPTELSPGEPLPPIYSIRVTAGAGGPPTVGVVIPVATPGHRLYHWLRAQPVEVAWERADGTGGRTEAAPLVPVAGGLATRPIPAAGLAAALADLGAVRFAVRCAGGGR